MKKFIFLLILLMPCLAQGVLSKSETTEALAWTKITAATGTTGIKETGTIDVSGNYSTTLHIDVCIAEASAHEGTEVIVQMSSEAGVDGSWSTLARFISRAATGLKADFAGVEAIGQTTLSITNPGTANIDHVGKFLFVEASTTTSCEIVYQIDTDGDTGDSITILDGLDHGQDTGSDVWSVDGDGYDNSAVNTWPVIVPFSASQVRVIINNSYDSDGTAADIYARVRVTEVTAL